VLVLTCGVCNQIFRRIEPLSSGRAEGQAVDQFFYFIFRPGDQGDGNCVAVGQPG
jgi:hypothetical protein